jgi:RNA polymerase-binding transcription factor DksA
MDTKTAAAPTAEGRSKVPERVHAPASLARSEMFPRHPTGYLQRAAGNQITARLLRAPAIQPKLTVNRPDDAYEREADQVADEVMRMPDPSPGVPSRATPGVQRMCADCEEEVHRTPDVRLRVAPVVSRMCHACASEQHDQAEGGPVSD